MTTINTYLTFDGNCEAAFNFYKSVFGGEFAHLGKFNEMPPDPKNPMSEEDLNKVMHVSLPIGKEALLMGSDTGGEWSPNFTPGNNFSISINTDTKAEADRIFNQLAQNGKTTMPMTDTFWGSYFGMCTDQFGINWMMSVETQKK